LQIFREGAIRLAPEFHLTWPAAALAQDRNGLSKVSDIERSDASRRFDWNEVQRQGGHGSQPARAEAALSIEERGPDDAIVSAARGKRMLARELRGNESATRFCMQAQC
jgi:hypothetical protein